MGSLGLSWDGLGQSLGGLETVLGSIRGVFGRSWVILVQSRDGLGAILGQSWAVLVRFWGPWGGLRRKCCFLFIGFKVRIGNDDQNVVCCHWKSVQTGTEDERHAAWEASRGVLHHVLNQELAKTNLF